MNLLLWIFVGWLAGAQAGRSLEGKGYGPSMGIVMGIFGAAAGGLLMRSAGYNGYTGVVSATFVAMIGAVLLTLLTGLMSGRRMYARQT